jgi:predicted transcriptional regulator
MEVFNNTTGAIKMESTSLMFELSHPERLRMLDMLREKSRRLSELSKEMNITTAEVSRHIERLIKAKLIEKNHGNYYKITRFASMILSEYSNIDFLTKNVDFFLNHNLGVIPQELQWLNSMAEGEFIEGALEITSLMWDYNKGAKNYIYEISDQVMRAMVDITSKKIDEGVIVKKIYPKDAQLPPEYTSRINENHEIRTLDEIPLSMIITERNAGLSFRGENGGIDFSTNIKGENEDFRRWVTAVFEYYWRKAKPIL